MKKRGKSKKRDRPVRKNLILRFCVFVFAVYAAVTLVNMQIEITQRRLILENMQKQNEVQRMVNKDLARKIENGFDDETIERLAREQDYVYPEEKIYFDISGS